MNINTPKYLKLNKLVFYFSKKNKELFNPEEGTCANYSFEKPNNLKEIYNAWDVFINWSIEEGNSHIAFTMNINDIKNNICVNDYTNLLKLHPITPRSEGYRWYISNYSGYIDGDNGLFFSEFSNLLKCNRLVTWIFVTSEENKEGILHIRGIIAYRNLMDYNLHIKNNMLSNLKEKMPKSDVLLKTLKSFGDIKRWIKYLHKDKVMVFPPYLYILEKHLDFLERIFLNPYNENYALKNTCIGWVPGIQTDDLDNYSNFWVFIEEYNYIQGIKINKNKWDQNIFLDLILYYISINKLLVNDTHVYRRIEGTKIAVENIGSIREVFFDNFEKNILIFFKETFPCQFKGLDFYFLLKTFKLKAEDNILKIASLIPNKINIDFNVMEFNDGIYDIRFNKFIPVTTQTDIKERYTVKYYNKSYGKVRQDKPEIEKKSKGIPPKNLNLLKLDQK